MRITIVEDEALIADHLALCLEDAGYEVTAIFDAAEELIAQFKTIETDLVLIDINLAGVLDGIDLAHAINKETGWPFVFLTSNTEPRTIERVKLTEPGGFIVKPFQAKDLTPAIELAMFKQQKTPVPVTDTSEDASFMIKDKQAMKRVYYRDINYVEAADNYSIVYVGDQRYMLSQTLKTIAGKLEPFGFFRVHRSYVINLRKVDCLLPGKVQLGNIELPTSPSTRQELLAFFDTL
jgi:DNA-binding LytR/AlgR family response regulator